MSGGSYGYLYQGIEFMDFDAYRSLLGDMISDDAALARTECKTTQHAK